MARRKKDQVDWRVLTIVATVLALIIVPGLGTIIGAMAIIIAVGLALVGSLREGRRRRRWMTVNSFFALSPEEFEEHVADTYRFMGYKTQMTKRVGDQGVDVIATRGDERLAIQCKRYADKASNAAVQAVHAGRVHYGCNAAAVVCLGGFSQSAHSIASSTRVSLIDGGSYADLVHKVVEARPLSPLAVPPARTILLSAALVTIAIISISLDLTHRVAAHR